MRIRGRGCGDFLHLCRRCPSRDKQLELLNGAYGLSKEFSVLFASVSWRDYIAFAVS